MPNLTKRRLKLNMVAQGNVLAKHEALSKEFDELKNSVPQKDIDNELKRSEKIMSKSELLLKCIEIGQEVKYDKKRDRDEVEVQNIKTQNKRKNTNKNFEM